MRDEHVAPFAAILYQEGAAGDLFLTRIATLLQAKGQRLCGVVQSNEQYDALCACDMTLSDLSTGHEIRISQRLGRYARGCRLDSARLAEAVGLAEAGFDAGADLVVLNKFGKAESQGSGFLPLLVRAVDAGIPVLVGLNAQNVEAWNTFTGGMGTVLPPDEAQVMKWIEAFGASYRASA